MGGKATDYLDGIVNNESRYDRVKFNPNVYTNGQDREISHKDIILSCYGSLFGEGSAKENTGCFWEGLSPLIWMARDNNGHDDSVYEVIRASMDNFLGGPFEGHFSTLESGLRVPLYRAVGEGLIKRFSLPEGKFMEGVPSE